MLNILWFRLYPSDWIGVGIYLWPERPILSLYVTLIFMSYRDRLSVGIGIARVDNSCFFLYLYLYIRIHRSPSPKKTCIYLYIHTKTHSIACVCVRLYKWKQRHFFLLLHIEFNSTNCPLPLYPSINRNKKNRRETIYTDEFTLHTVIC